MSLPGYLYAKSLRRQEPKASGYSRLFMNAALSRYERDITSIQDSFEWSVYSNEPYAPVVACRKVQDGMLVVRFFDEGLDAFHRPHTLRVEGMLAADETLASALDGSNECVPNANDATFEISGSGRVADLCDPGTEWKFIGDETTYSCLGCGRGDEDTACPSKCVEKFAPKQSSKCKNQKEGQPMTSGGNRFTICILVAAVVVLGGFSFYQYRQSGNLERQLDRVRDKLRASDERQKELQKWYDDRTAFAQDLASAKKTVSDLKRKVADLESSLRTMERRLNVTDRSSGVTDISSEVCPSKAETRKEQPPEKCAGNDAKNPKRPKEERQKEDVKPAEKEENLWQKGVDRVKKGFF